MARDVSMNTSMFGWGRCFLSESARMPRQALCRRRYLLTWVVQAPRRWAWVSMGASDAASDGEVHAEGKQRRGGQRRAVWRPWPRKKWLLSL